MMILHKQKASVGFFFYHLFSPVHHSHSCLPPWKALQERICSRIRLVTSNPNPPPCTPSPLEQKGLGRWI